MTEYSQFYEKNLYPLQNKILNILQQCKSPFYLTGGTALSRFYFNHRYSDDLDFFVNGFSQDDYLNCIKICINSIKDKDFIVDTVSDITSGSFRRIFVSEKNTPSVKLKIEFINDIEIHYGSYKTVNEYDKIDSLINILTNKYTALYRYSIKDCVDIYEICKNHSFNWADIINKSNEKEVGISVSDIANILSDCGKSRLEKIKWINSVDLYELQDCLKIISNDILFGQNNSLCNTNPLE